VEAMTKTVTIENPGKVIDTLTARISKLENQLAFQIAENRRAAPERDVDLLRWMRKRAVIPLYVGDQDAEMLKTKEFVGDELISQEVADKAFKQVWLLDNAPVTQDVNDAMRKATNYVLNRF